MKKHKIFFLAVLLLASGAFYFSAQEFGWGNSAKRMNEGHRMVADVGSNSDSGPPTDYYEKNMQEDMSCRTPEYDDSTPELERFSIDELLERHDGTLAKQDHPLSLWNLLGLTDNEIDQQYNVESGFSAAEVKALKAFKKCRNTGIFAETAADVTEGVRYPWWNELSPKLTLDLERQYDVFILINTQVQRSAAEEAASSSTNFADLLKFSFNNVGDIKIPRQHIKILVRNRPANHTDENTNENDIFIRDGAGVITGINESNVLTQVSGLESLETLSTQLSPEYRAERVSWSENELPYYLIPTTTGVAGNGGIKTVNGIFNMNYTRSRNRRGLAGYIEDSAPMSHPVYIETYYSNRQESGIAIHGTPPGNRRNLGVKRGSHGCARVHIDHADALARWIFSLTPRSVPKLDWRTYEAYDSAHNSDAWIIQNETVNRPPVLFVIFNGYEER